MNASVDVSKRLGIFSRSWTNPGHRRSAMGVTRFEVGIVGADRTIVDFLVDVFALTSSRRSTLPPALCTVSTRRARSSR